MDEISKAKLMAHLNDLNNSIMILESELSRARNTFWEMRNLLEAPLTICMTVQDFENRLKSAFVGVNCKFTNMILNEPPAQDKVEVIQEQKVE